MEKHIQTPFNSGITQKYEDTEYYNIPFSDLCTLIGEPAAIAKVQMYGDLSLRHQNCPGYAIHTCRLLTSYGNFAPLDTGEENPENSILDRQVSVFYATVPGTPDVKGIKNTFYKKDLSARIMADLIRSDTFAPETEELRMIDKSTPEGKKANSDFKNTKFCYATWSCTGTRRKGDKPEKHSGLICIDVDGIPERLKEVQEAINQDPWTVISFISPNGDGLKVIYEIEEGAHSQKEYYRAYRSHLSRLCSIPLGVIDVSCSNVGRACYLPFDPFVFVNPGLL